MTSVTTERYHRVDTSPVSPHRMKISLWGTGLSRSVRTALVLTQRGGSCPRSFPFVLGANRTCTWEAPAPGPPTRQPRWGGVAERKRSGPPARGWLAPSTQGPLGSCWDLVLQVCVVVLIAGALRRMRSHAETPSHQDPRHRGWVTWLPRLLTRTMRATRISAQPATAS